MKKFIYYIKQLLPLTYHSKYRVPNGDIDHNLIKNYPWKEDKIGYVVYRGIPMHSFIIGQFCDLDEVEVIDHADRNKINNRLNNLRLTNY